MPSKWGTKISSRGIGFFCCFCRLNLSSRAGNFWLGSLQHKAHQMNEQHKYSLFPYWSVDGLYEQYLAAFVRFHPVIARKSQAEMIMEITVMKLTPFQFIAFPRERKRELKRDFQLTRSWDLSSSCWCYPSPFPHLLLSDHLKPESLTPRSGLYHQFHLWSPCFRFLRTGTAVRVRRGPR